MWKICVTHNFHRVAPNPPKSLRALPQNFPIKKLGKIAILRCGSFDIRRNIYQGTDMNQHNVPLT